jgi:hypothetical protein
MNIYIIDSVRDDILYTCLQHANQIIDRQPRIYNLALCFYSQHPLALFFSSS